MKRHFRLIMVILLLGIICPHSEFAESGWHPLTKIYYDRTTDKNTLDLVVSCDWDYDTVPAYNRAYVTSVINQWAKSFYTMTEGKLVLGNVYVYPNKLFFSGADVLFHNKTGRANANVNGLFDKGSDINIFTLDNGSPEPAADIGMTLAHELGHYGLGILDEYREVGGMSKDDESPQDGDTPRNTIMCEHLNYTNISTPTDYQDSANRKTAQYRGLKASAWETVISNPASDPANFRTNNPARRWFEAFKSKTVPTAATLTSPATGWETSLSVKFMAGGAAVNVVILDTDVPADSFKAMIAAAQNLVNAAGTGTRLAVLTSPDLSASPQSTLVALNAGNKNTINTAIRALTRGTSGRTGAAKGAALAPAFAQAVTLITGVGGRGSADTAFVHFFTNPDADISAEAFNSFDNNKIPVNAIVLGASANKANGKNVSGYSQMNKPQTAILVGGTPQNSTNATYISIEDLVSGTNGKFSAPQGSSDAAKVADQLMNESEGESQSILSASGDTGMAAGATLNIEAEIGANEDAVYFTAFWDEADEGKYSFSLVAPGGAVITPTTLPAGITYQVDTSSHYAEYVVSTTYAGRVGIWNANLKSSSAASGDALVTAVADTLLTMETTMLGGTAADPRNPVLLVNLRGPLPILGATVTATIYNQNGTIVASDIPCHDDGVAPDSKANDGVYSAALASYLPGTGDYLILVSADDNSGSATQGTAGALVAGTDAPATPTGSFSRMDTTSVSYSKEATSSSGSSGGCTLGGGNGYDLSLLLLACAAVAARFVMNRRARRA